MRTAALARDGVDGLDAVRPHLVEALGGERDHLVLAHAGLQCLVDVLVDAVYHGRRHVQERQLVLALDHACLEHGLLSVAPSRPTSCSANRNGGSTRSIPSGILATPSACKIRLISCAACLNKPALGETAPRMPTMPASDCRSGIHGA